MKPSLFSYAAPDSVAEAIEILSNDPGAMILAGGQSLLPAMNFRLASPTQLVDIRNVAGLSELTVEGDLITVGAMVRHRDIELDEHVYAANPLIREAMRFVAHAPIRNRGTLVGSLCHADAAAEMPLILVLTGGSVAAQGPNGSRDIPADDFFQFHMTTARSSDEVIVRATIPALPDGAGYAFNEFSRRKGDYAIAAVGVIVSLDRAGTVTRAAIGACGIGSRPLRLEACEALAVGSSLEDADAKTIAAASGDYVTTPDDIHATTAYRQHLLSGLLRLSLSEARDRARRGQPS
jgi:CO/xanthine dehydrogenase FAD-binding subunit